MLAVGAREHQRDEGWGGYPVEEVALRHGAGVERETNDAAEAYAGLPDSQADGVPRRLAARRRAVLVAVREAPPGVGVNSICVHTDSKEPQRRCPKP